MTFESAEGLMVPGLAALAFLGIALIRSAYVHRQGSWIMGLILGGLFVLVGVAGAIGILLS